MRLLRAPRGGGGTGVGKQTLALLNVCKKTKVHEKDVTVQIEHSRKLSLQRLIASSLESRVEALYEQFTRLSETASCGIVDYRRLRRAEFVELLPRVLQEISEQAVEQQQQLQQQIQMQRSTSRLLVGGQRQPAPAPVVGVFDFTDAFEAFDQNRDNYVDAKEFVIGLSLVFPHAPFEEKVASCFRSFDLRKLNRLNIEDCAQCLKWMRNFLMALDPQRSSPNAMRCENIDDFLEACVACCAWRAVRGVLRVACCACVCFGNAPVIPAMAR